MDPRHHNICRKGNAEQYVYTYMEVIQLKDKRVRRGLNLNLNTICNNTVCKNTVCNKTVCNNTLRKRQVV